MVLSQTEFLNTRSPKQEAVLNSNEIPEVQDDDSFEDCFPNHWAVFKKLDSFEVIQTKEDPDLLLAQIGNRRNTNWQQSFGCVNLNFGYSL